MTLASTTRTPRNMHDAARVGMKLLNVMLNSYAADGHELTDREIIDTYGRTAEVGDKVGVELSFELHVDCWSEKYERVTPIVNAVRSEGLTFDLTLDYSHVVFKIDDPEQQQISASGKVEPDASSSIRSKREAFFGMACARRNPLCAIPARGAAKSPQRLGENPDGSLPRGIMYPFVKPQPGE